MTSPCCGEGQQGLTLVEMVAFLIVVGVGAAAMMPMIRNVLPRAADPSEVTRAVHLAQSRMELIVGQRALSGFSGLNDPCQAASPPACVVPTGYTLTVVGLPLAQAWPTNTDTWRFRLVTVRVTGPDGSVLSTLNHVTGNY
jgi:Tfp pilus assembly protein PilE